MHRIRIARLVPLALSLLLWACVVSAARAAEPPTTINRSAINHEQGVAIRGYDPVAYFTVGKPVAGIAKYSVKQGGATFRFANSAHRDSFKVNPKKYAPLYGGFCAYGTAQGYKATIDPNAWTLVDGRLYLNYNAEVQAMWKKDVPGFIEQADRKWPEVKKTEKVFQ